MYCKTRGIAEVEVRFDVANYDHLNANDILSGYLSHVHSSRDSKIEMVKQLQLKYDYVLLAYLYSFSPQVFRL